MASFHTIPPPPSFEIHDRNAAELWKDWRQRWECYASAMELTKKSSEVQVATLLTVIGAEAHKVYNTFELTEVHCRSLVDLELQILQKQLEFLL